MEEVMGPAWNRYAPVALEGLKYIFIALAVFLISVIFTKSLIFQILSLVLLCFIIFFFRNPERLVPLDEHAIISPADGTVMIAEPITSKDGTQQFKIAIFLSIFNVHINRTPITGVIKRVTYRPGRFSMAFRPKESEDNEQNTIVIENSKGRRLTVIQIAGFLARRIVCYVKEGMYISSGDRFGLIQFGSRTDLIVEGDVDVHVKVGDKVLGGQTILAHYRD